MKTLIKILLPLLLLSSCLTKKQAERLCASRELKDSTSNTTKEVVTKHDTDISVPEKDGGDFNFVISDNCDSLKAALEYLKQHPIKKTVRGITTSVVSNGKTITLNCREEAYRLLLKNAIIERDTWKNAYKQVVYHAPCDKRHHTGWDTFGNYCAWILIITFLIALLFFALHIYEKTGKLI